MGGSGSGLVTLIIVWAIGMLLSRLFGGRAGPSRRRAPPFRFPAGTGAERWRRPAGAYRSPEPDAVEDLRPREERPAARSVRGTSAEEPAPAGRPAPARRVAEPDAAPVVEYLGSLGVDSSEGVTMEGQISGPPDSVAKRLGVTALAGASASPAVRQALSLLRRPEGAAEGAAAAIVLSEILGPPRALKPRRTAVAERMGARAGHMPVGRAER